MLPIIPVSAPPIARAKKRAFTLVEMLVVLSIIGLIAVLLIPGINRAQASLKKAQCVSNMRQICAGLMAYVADNDGTFPIDIDNSKGGGQNNVWGTAIWTYVGYKGIPNYPENDLQGNAGADRNIFHCPVTKYYPKAKFKEICVPASYPVANRFSYAMNSAPSRVAYGTAGIPMKMGRIKSPSATALLLEMHEAGGNQWAYHNAFGLIPHQGGCNVLYYDGHVEWLAYKDVPPDKDYADSTLSPFWSGN